MRYLFTAVLLCSFNVQAADAIERPDALEKEITSCFLANQTNCTEKVLGSKILPGNENLISASKQIDEFVGKWLNGEKIHATHFIRSFKSGEVFQKRTYLLEDSSGSLMVFNYSLLKRLGKWYVFSFNVNSASDAIKAVFEPTACERS